MLGAKLAARDACETVREGSAAKELAGPEA